MSRHFASEATEFPLPEGTFDAALNGYTFDEWTFNLGYMNQIDLPTGKVDIPAGTFYGDVNLTLRVSIPIAFRW